MVMVLNGEVLWNKVISGLTGAGEELQTSTGLWFRALAKDGKLYVQRACQKFTAR